MFCYVANKMSTIKLLSVLKVKKKYCRNNSVWSNKINFKQIIFLCNVRPRYNIMLGIHKRQHPKDIFVSGSIPNVPFPKWQLPTYVLAATLSHLAHPSRIARTYCSLWRLRRPNLTLWKLPLGKRPLGKYLTSI